MVLWLLCGVHFVVSPLLTVWVDAGFCDLAARICLVVFPTTAFLYIWGIFIFCEPGHDRVQAVANRRFGRLYVRSVRNVRTQHPVHKVHNNIWEHPKLHGYNWLGVSLVSYSVRRYLLGSRFCSVKNINGYSTVMTYLIPFRNATYLPRSTYVHQHCTVGLQRKVM
jgi:hypothetical protein